MFTPMEKSRFQAAVIDGCKWYTRNQNTDKNPWGGMRGSAEMGRFVYEYFPMEKVGRGGSQWSQATGIMALHSANLQFPNHYHAGERAEAARMAGEYMVSLQNDVPHRPECDGGFRELTYRDKVCYPRDAATAGMGLAALYRLTGDEEFKARGLRFCDWYWNHASDENGWPYIHYNFEKGEGGNAQIVAAGEAAYEKEYTKGDWQAGGALAYFYIACVTGDRKLIDERMLPVVDKAIPIYEANPIEICKDGFHGEVPISLGNDDFALVTLLAAYRATGDKKYYDVARDRILSYLKIVDEDTGFFPSFAGTFVCAITMKVLLDLDESEGREADPKLVELLRKAALAGLELQAHDYNEPRIDGGYWGQTPFGAARNWIHHRSTGYATILYSMLSGDTPIPYYHCLHWDIPGM